PGHFVRIKAWKRSYDPLLPRPFAIFETDGESSFTILFKVQPALGDPLSPFSPGGKGTHFLKNLSVQAKVDIDGPHGNPFPTYRKKRVCLVAGGVGIAPLYFYAQQLRENDCEVVVFYGVARQSDLVVLEDLKRVSHRVFVSVEESGMEQGHLYYGQRVTDLFQTLGRRENFEVILACGPKVMLKHLGKLCEELFPSAEVYLSFEAMMACGRGLCLGCVVPRQGRGHFKICLEGPALPAREVDLDRLD
ncbi:MAG: hypothetical protein DSZ24_04610, partial [Thermodesulfatator sp.]